LSVKELSLKKELEESLRKIFKFYEEFQQNRTQLESEVNDHFQEMRFQIDQHREELKKIIDDIALEMIDETQKNEAVYLNNLKEKLSLRSSSFRFDTSQSLTNELNQIEETFRDPNLLIQTIKEMHQKQEESLNEIQFKLTEMTKIKDNLKVTNEFKSNLSSLNPKETSLFGSIKLDGHWFSFSSFKSEILTNEQQCLQLIKLCEL
jgi:hypothetical protein